MFLLCSWPEFWKMKRRAGGGLSRRLRCSRSSRPNQIQRLCDIACCGEKDALARAVPQVVAEYVVKPTSGAGARFAARYTPDEHETAVRQLERMHAEGLTAMVQPYLTNVDVSGERALLFFGGRFVHASRKGAVLARGTASPS